MAAASTRALPPAHGSPLMLRDLIFLVIAVSGVVLTMRGTGSLFMEDTVTVPLYTPVDVDIVPRPVVADLDGDGAPELLIATSKPSLVSYRIAPPGSAKPGTLTKAAEAELLWALRVGRPRAPIALAAGSLSSDSKKQIVIVVTADWSVMAYDSNLKLLWRTTVNNLINSVPAGVLRHREIAVHISDIPIVEGDAGSVFVSGSLEYVPNADKDALDAGLVAKITAELDHLSFYGLDGASGTVRWKHEGSAMPSVTASSDALHPQIRYKLSSVDAVQQHGSKSWQTCRYSLLQTLPHAWSKRDHTTLDTAYFIKQGPADKKPAAEQDDNVVIAHGRHGVEAVHIYSGRPQCELPLPTGYVYDDVNGDNIIDRIQVVGAREGVAVGLEDVPAAIKIPGCMVKLATGFPMPHVVWNASVCHSQPLVGENAIRAGTLGRPRFQSVDVAPPVVIPESDTGAVSRICTFVSAGVVTCHSHKGAVRWQVDLQAGWRVDNSPSGKSRPAVTGIYAGALKPTMPVTSENGILVVVGDKQLTVMDAASGSIAAQVRLNTPVLQDPLIADVNGDGFSDVITLQTEGWTCILMRARVGNPYFLGLLLVPGLFIFVLVLGRLIPQPTPLKSPFHAPEGRSRAGSALAPWYQRAGVNFMPKPKSG